jgi:hypothetical protein
VSAGVYRAPMPGAVERALELGVVGLPAYADERGERRTERFCAVPDGAEVWTRDDAGFFHRGVVTGPCRPGPDDELAQVRDCAWDAPRAEPAVPAAVAATFRRGGRNFQRIRAL